MLQDPSSIPGISTFIARKGSLTHELLLAGVDCTGLDKPTFGSIKRIHIWILHVFKLLGKGGEREPSSSLSVCHKHKVG